MVRYRPEDAVLVQVAATMAALSLHMPGGPLLAAGADSGSASTFAVRCSEVL